MNKKFFKSLLISLLTGLAVGLVVGLYQFILPYVVKFSNDVFASREWWVITLNAIGILFLGFLNFYILKLAPSIDSSGIIGLNLNIKRDEDIKCIKELPLMIVNSCASSYAMMPLGSEGPSITLAGKTAALINKLFKVNDKENVQIACGAGFGAAFISPLSGFFYSFEEELHKINLKTFLRAIVTMLGMFTLIVFLNHHHSMGFEELSMLNIEDSLVLIVAFLLIIIVALLYLFIVQKIKEFYLKHENNVVIKYRGFLFFALMIILGYTLTPLVGNGDKIISLSLTLNTWYVFILLILFRTLMTGMMGTGKVSGGLIIPSLAIGALVGGLSSLSLESMNPSLYDNREFIILLSMCMFFSFISEAPLTSITLFYSNLVYSTNSFNVFNKVTLLGAILIIMTYLAAKVINNTPLYDMLTEVQEKHLQCIELAK